MTKEASNYESNMTQIKWTFVGGKISSTQLVDAKWGKDSLQEIAQGFD
jgi:hypothetical protein